MEQDHVRMLPQRTSHLPHFIATSQLPTPLTSFIGREQEVTAICQLLQERHARLLTLTGPAGVGKTRLALEVARQLLACFPDGMFFVPFASLRNPLLVFPHLVSTFALDEHSGLSPADLLKVHLQHASLLLLLDNFEHLLRAAPGLLDLLQACPALTILVTSRALLRVQGEQVFEVLPFTLPKIRSGETTEQLLDAPAVQLFVERAQALIDLNRRK